MVEYETCCQLLPFGSEAGTAVGNAAAPCFHRRQRRHRRPVGCAPKRPHDCPWKTQNDFRRVYLSHGTAVWDSGEESVDYSPTDLYVRAGFADWEEILADPDPDKIVVEFVRDCRGDRIFARSSTGKEGHLKVSPAMFSGAQYTLPDSPQGKTVIAPWGDVLWRNKHEIEAEVIDRHLSAKAA